MANYPLSTLLDLRQHRLDDAQRATVAQRLIVQKQVEKVQSLKEELVRREAEGEKHIALIYEEIMNTLIPKDSMGEHMGKIRTTKTRIYCFIVSLFQNSICSSSIIAFPKCILTFARTFPLGASKLQVVDVICP